MDSTTTIIIQNNIIIVKAYGGTAIKYLSSQNGDLKNTQKILK